MKNILKQKVINYVTSLWEKTQRRDSLFLSQKIVFYCLCVLEVFYCVVFYFSQKLKNFFGNYCTHMCKIISVGNITVGGTGKTVFVGFLVRNFLSKDSAIISRGYGREKKENVFFDGFSDKQKDDLINKIGDEPVMLSCELSVPVGVGGNRAKVLRRLLDICKKTKKRIKYIVLDDGYQNQKLKKNLEILLLDSRSPFGNGHCLPAGSLREKDLSRADVILLTHADKVSITKRILITQDIKKLAPNIPIICGRYIPVGLFENNKSRILQEFFINKKFLIAAGIGSFDGFVNYIRDYKITVGYIKKYSDHYNYSKQDINDLYNLANKYSFDGIIVTLKDWYKLCTFIEKNNLVKIYVFRIEFEFLTQEEYSFFEKVLLQKIE